MLGKRTLEGTMKAINHKENDISSCFFEGISFPYFIYFLLFIYFIGFYVILK